MPYKITMEGIPELQKTFESRRKEIEQVFINDLNEGADAIKASAKSKVHSISGDLEGSIDRNEVWNRDGKIDVYIGVDVNEEFTPTGLYGIAVEKGHVMENGTSRVPAHPFLRPALNENKAQIESKIESDLNEVIEK